MTLTLTFKDLSNEQKNHLTEVVLQRVGLDHKLEIDQYTLDIEVELEEPLPEVQSYGFIQVKKMAALFSIGLEHPLRVSLDVLPLTEGYDYDFTQISYVLITPTVNFKKVHYVLSEDCFRHSEESIDLSQDEQANTFTYDAFYDFYRAKEGNVALSDVAFACSELLSSHTYNNLVQVCLPSYIKIVSTGMLIFARNEKTSEIVCSRPIGAGSPYSTVLEEQFQALSEFVKSQ